MKSIKSNGSKNKQGGNRGGNAVEGSGVAVQLNGKAVPQGEVQNDNLFAHIRLASRTLTNLYNENMPSVTVTAGNNLTKEIPLKVTQLVVLKALYDTSWWGNCLDRRINRTSEERRDRLAKYYKEHAGMVVQIDLSHQLGLDCTTVCRNLKALVESGWVVSQRSDASQREVLVGLTPQGRKVVESAVACANATSEKLTACLGADFIDKLNRDLLYLIEKSVSLMNE